jgi:hypothetical protein
LGIMSPPFFSWFYSHLSGQEHLIGAFPAGLEFVFPGYQVGSEEVWIQEAGAGQESF